jgi:hypothetical protein
MESVNKSPTTAAATGRALLLYSLLTAAFRLPAQDLAPRAYVITPIHTNAVTLTWGYYNGGLDFAGTIPITGATGSYSVPVISLYHTLSFLGRSANLTASLPYAVGTFEGAVLGTKTLVYRSGLLDASFRFSVNLLGGPAMPPKTTKNRLDSDRPSHGRRLHSKLPARRSMSEMAIFRQQSFEIPPTPWLSLTCPFPLRKIRAQ